MNLYGDVQTTFSVPGLLLEYVVPSSRAVKLTSLIGWGDTSAEYLIYINGEPRGGARSSSESRTVQVWWDSPLIANSEDLIEVVGCHYSTGLKNLKVNLIGTFI